MAISSESAWAEDPDLDHWCEPEDSWPEYDAQGIYLCRVCPDCKERKLAGYRPEIVTGYDQSDVDEPIEADGPIEDGDLVPHKFW